METLSADPGTLTEAAVLLPSLRAECAALFEALGLAEARKGLPLLRAGSRTILTGPRVRSKPPRGDRLSDAQAPLEGARGERIPMSAYKIAWLPGDGVGKEVMEATRIVLDALKLDAATRTVTSAGSSGARRERRCRSGRSTSCSDAAMFGAITSKPVKAAEAELAPALRGTGLIYRSPIVRMRQIFDLYICLRPCKAYPGNPLNFKETIDLVIFRENTEDLYAGVEFSPVPDELAETLKRSRSRSRPSPSCRATSTRSRARSTRGRAPSGSSAPPSSSRGSSAGRR